MRPTATRARHREEILVERYLPGIDHRLLGRRQAGSGGACDPPLVIGDCQRSVRWQLVEIVNRDPKRGTTATPRR